MLKRSCFWLLLIAALIMLAIPAAAETYVLNEVYASIDIPEQYVVLTGDNLTEYSEWLEGRGTTQEAVTNDFIKRGVILQAWDNENSACFEIRAVQTEESQLIFDVNEQSSGVRGEYRTSHFPNNEYAGYDFSSSDWKNTDEGRFLILKYIRRDNGEILYRGFMRRTIRNGYQIDCDMQIYGRAATDKDNSNLNKLWNTFHFIQVLEMPPAAKAQLMITNPPPVETNEKKFVIGGTAAKGVAITTVVMGMMSNADPVVTTTVVDANGKFSISIQLSKEGVFVITLFAEFQDQEIYEKAYPVTYEHTLLTVNFTSEPGEAVMENEVKISGTSVPGASIQMFVNENAIDTKKVTSAGKFAVTFDTFEEGEYNIALVFNKSGLESRRFNWVFTRRWTENDTQEYLQRQAVKPAYQTLINKMEGYTGRIMGYEAYLVNCSESNGQYVLLMAMHRKNKVYSQYLLVMTDEKPRFEIGEKLKMYGTCEGMSSIADAPEEMKSEASYPCFSLLLLCSLE